VRYCFTVRYLRRRIGFTLNTRRLDRTQAPWQKIQVREIAFIVPPFCNLCALEMGWFGGAGPWREEREREGRRRWPNGLPACLSSVHSFDCMNSFADG
jgi:hypothetical protein